MGMDSDLRQQRSQWQAGLDPWALVGVDSSGAGTQASAWYDALVNYYGVPPDVARSMVNNPSYAEGQTPSVGWPHKYRGQEQEAIAGQQYPPMSPTMERGLRGRGPQQDISYQPGGRAMPGMPWDASGGGTPMQSQMSPQDIQRMRLMMQIMGSRGTGGMAQNPFGGGMQFGQNVPGAQAANQLAQGGMSPQMMQMLMYYLQNGLGPQMGGGMQGPPPNYPQGGGGVDLGAMMQALGYPASGASR